MHTELTITIYISLKNLSENLELIYNIDRAKSEIEVDNLLFGKEPFAMHHQRSEVIPQYAVNVSLRTFCRLIKLNKNKMM